MSSAGLHPNRLKDEEQLVIRKVACVPVGVTIADVLKPEFWVHVAPRLRPLAYILVLPDDGTWEAHLRVRSVSGKAAQVELLEPVKEYSAAAPAPDDSFVVEWGGPVHLWRVVRRSDNAVIEKGIQTKEAAYARLPELLKAA